MQVSLTGRAGHAFAVNTMLQGYGCHTRGVEVTQSSAAHAKARVKSKRTHDVDLRAKDGALLVHCSCPARSMGVDFCRHAWATLLEIDRLGGLEDLRTSTQLLKLVPSEPQPQPAPEPKKKKAAKS